MSRYVDITLSFSSSKAVWYCSIDDVPYCRQLISATVTNVGNKDAENVEISAYFTGNEIYSTTSAILSDNQFTFSLDDLELRYDTSQTITVTASCKDEEESRTYTLSANFP